MLKNKNSVPIKKKKVKMETTFIKIGKSQGKVLNGAIKRSSQQRRLYKTSCLLAKEKKNKPEINFQSLDLEKKGLTH